MRGLFAALVFLLFVVTAFAQTPTISPSTPTAFKNGKINFTCTANCGTGGTWSCSGCAGSIDPSTGVYSAPAAIKAQQQLAGYQFLPNNAVFNVDISGLPASAITGATGIFNMTDSFPLNYITNSTPTDNMVFFYTPGHNGTYFTPSQNNFLSGNIESGWYVARRSAQGNTDHHYLRANSDVGTYEEQYQYYPVGTSLSCSTCNSASGVKYKSTSYAAPDLATDAASLYIMPLILRRQEFDHACNGGVGGGSINHALRLTLPAGYIGRTFIWPAQAESPGGGTHSYGERFRLKSSFNEAGFSPCARIILEELKHYGLFVADIGLNWQANIEITSWSEADEGYFAEINTARIADTNFEKVDESGLEINSTSLEANTSRETVSFTSSSGTVSAEVVLLGITVGTLQDAVDIMAGSPGIQLKAVIQGDTTINWSLSSAVGSITPSGVYTPPSTASSEMTIRAIATSNADNTISADTLIRIWPSGTAYALPSWSSGNDYTDSHGHIWKSGAGIGITNQPGNIGCCAADDVGLYTGPATDHQLWNQIFSTSETDFHIYWFVPAGTYTLTFHSIAPAAAGARKNDVNFVAQGSTLATNVDFAASVGQYGPYTRTDSLTVGCDNLLTYDEQMYDDGGSAPISSFSITQNTNAQASCSTPAPSPTPTPTPSPVSSTTVSASGPEWGGMSFGTPQSGSFTAELDVTPLASSIDAGIGLSNGPQTAFTGLACIGRFNQSGFIDARNGGSYTAVNSVPYIANQTYHLRFVMSVSTHTYSLFVTPPGQSEQTVASNYAFRTEQQSVTTLNFWSFFADIGSMQVSNLLAPSSTAIANSVWMNNSFPNQSGSFQVAWDAMPTAGGMDGVMGLSNGPQTSFTGFACLVRFYSGNGTIQARNGGGYTADITLPYSPGFMYHFRLVVNIPNHSYSVYVTPGGGGEQLLANNYTFRTEQAGVTSLNNVGIIVDTSTGSLSFGNFTVSSAYDQAILADSPVAFWDLNSIAATETDLTGNGNTGTYQGGSPTIGTMPDGEPVAVFNGSNQYVSVPSSAPLSIPTTGNLTWEMWIQPTVLNFPSSVQTDGYVNVMGKCVSHPNTGLCEWQARMYNTTASQGRCNRMSAYVFNPNGGSGSAADWQPVCGLIQANEWLHIVGEYTTDPSKTPTDCTNGSTYPGAINIWVNGVIWDQAAHGQTGCMGQYSVVPQATSSQFNIGTVDTLSWFAGAIGKVAIYNHLLTQTQITNHYQTMTGKQPTGSCGATCTF